MEEIKKQKVNAFIAVFAWGLSFLADWCYTFDWFGVNERVYLFVRSTNQMYTIGELIVNLGSSILFLGCIIVIKRSTYLIKWMRYLTSFMFDIFFISTVYVVISNPYAMNWDKFSFVVAAIVVFVVQLVLHFSWEPFRKVKMF